MRDDIELTMLAESGDVEMAELAGLALAFDMAWEMLCDVMGLPYEVFR